MPETPVVDVTGVGLNATDTLIHVPEFPARGSKLEYETELVLPGGQVASAMVACSTWGLSTRYVGKLGDDRAATLHEREFARAGVEAQLIRAHGVDSAKSLILVDAQGERTVLCRRDERLTLAPHELRPEWITRARALHLDGHDTGAALRAATYARQAGVPVVADLDETYPGVERLMEKIDYLIVSRDFPGRLTGQAGLKQALCTLRERFGCRLAAATLGEGGVLAWTGQRFHYAPAYRVPVVDTTGAGDIFHAGFLYGLLQGWLLDRQLDFACAVAAMNCMHQGARGGIRPLEEVAAFLRQAERCNSAFSVEMQRT